MDLIRIGRYLVVLGQNVEETEHVVAAQRFDLHPPVLVVSGPRGEAVFKRAETRSGTGYFLVCTEITRKKTHLEGNFSADFQSIFFQFFKQSNGVGASCMRVFTVRLKFSYFASFAGINVTELELCVPLLREV